MNVSIPSPPLDRIRAAVSSGILAIEAAGLVAEQPEVAGAVERHRWAWKPPAIRVLLVAESHVYTSAEDLAIRINATLLPDAARHAPLEYVRLVYCLGYGETWLLNAQPRSNAGTWQFWNIFGRVAKTGRQPTRGGSSDASRLAWKVATLNRLREQGVWLLDSSLHGIYAPGATRVPAHLTTVLHRIWWEHYGSWLFAQCAGAYRCVIGKVTAAHLANLGVPVDNWIYQPQAERNVSSPQLDHGWPDLLRAASS